jgi:hypothetical protein
MWAVRERESVCVRVYESVCMRESVCVCSTTPSLALQDLMLYVGSERECVYMKERERESVCVCGSE